MRRNNKNRSGLRTILTTIVALLFGASSPAQTELTEQVAISTALAYHPTIKAAGEYVTEKQQLEKTSFSLPAPSLYTQSPTGAFYTIGVNQNIDFPTVYTNQKKVFKAETRLAENQALLTQQQLIWNIRTAYSGSKYATTKVRFLAAHDSLLSALQLSADRQFTAGEIDFIAKSFVDLQYGEIHQKYLLAQNEEAIALKNLQILCGFDSAPSIAPYTETELAEILLNDAQVVGVNPQMLVAKSEVEIARERIRLEKSKALPGIQLGYLNQASKDTPMNLRFQAGINIPLWWWQYGGRIKAAKANAERAAQSEQSISLSYQSALSAAQLRLANASQQLNYYLQSGMRQARELENSSRRFFIAGERDYTTHLRTLNDVMQVKFNFIDAALSYTDALAQLKFINGSI